MSRQPIGAKAMTPAERQRRSRKLRADELEKRRLDGAADRLVRKQRAVSAQAEAVAERKRQHYGEREAYVILLAPMNKLAALSEVDGRVDTLLAHMNAGQREILGRVARGVDEVLAKVKASLTGA